MTPDQIFDHFAKKHMIIYDPHGFRRRYRRLSIAIMASIKQALETPMPSEPIEQTEELSYKLKLQSAIKEAMDMGLEIPTVWVEYYNLAVRVEALSTDKIKAPIFKPSLLEVKWNKILKEINRETKT